MTYPQIVLKLREYKEDLLDFQREMNCFLKKIIYFPVFSR